MTNVASKLMAYELDHVLMCVSPEAPEAGRLAGLVDAGSIQFRFGAQHLLELGIDGKSQGQTADCRPELPLLVCW